MRVGWYVGTRASGSALIFLNGTSSVEAISGRFTDSVLDGAFDNLRDFATGRRGDLARDFGCGFGDVLMMCNGLTSPLTSLAFASFWKYFCACVRIWTTDLVLIIPDIFFHSLPFKDNPSKKRVCSSFVQRPVFSMGRRSRGSNFLQTRRASFRRISASASEMVCISTGTSNFKRGMPNMDDGRQCDSGWGAIDCIGINK